MLLAVADAGDGRRSSTVRLDGLRWSFGQGTVGQERRCDAGGAGLCVTCQDCLSANTEPCCGDPLAACTQDAGDAGCGGILACVQACGGASCQQACVAARPAGQAKYKVFHECIHGPPGDPVSFGACGLVCPP